MALDFARTFVLASGLLMLGLATLLLVAGRAQRLQRALGAAVALRALALIVPPASNLPQWGWATVRFQPYVVLALVPTTVYCGLLLAFPDQRRQRIAAWGTMAAIAVLEALYALDHDLFYTVATGTSEIGALRAFPGIIYTAFGPLSVVGALSAPAFGYLALQAAMAHRKGVPGLADGTTFLVALGLMVGSLFDASNRLVAFTSLVGEGGYPWLPWGWASAGLPAVLAVFPAAASAGVLASTSSTRASFVVLGAAAVGFGAGFVRVVVGSDSDPGGQSFVLVVLALTRLLMPVLLASAFLRPPRTAPATLAAAPQA